MPLESVIHLDDLEVANPLGTDPRSEGDDHIRNIKKALKTDFPNITGVVSASTAELNLTSGITAGTVLASKFVLVDASKKVNEWLVDNVTIDGNSITSTSGDLQLKAVSGSNLTLQDDADAAKEVTLVMSTVTSGQDRSWTFPDSDGTFIGAATTDTLTNKTIDAGEFTTDLNLDDSVPIRLGTAEDSSIEFDGTDLIILTDGAGASGIILDSEDDTVEIKGSGTLQATFDAGGLDLASGDAYEINDVSVLNATTLGGDVVSSSLTSTGALNSGSITSGFGAIDNGASAITSTGTITGGVVVADNIQLDANAITSTDTDGDLTLTPNGTGDLILDGVKWPQADGSANYFLRTDGSAQASWQAAVPTSVAGVLDYQFETATTAADQGAGKLWLNHGTIASATVLYLDDDDDNGTDVSAWTATWDDSSNTQRGYISFKSLAAPSTKYAIFEITGATTDSTAYQRFSVTHKVSAGSFSDTEKVVVDFVRYGNVGATGATGAAGEATNGFAIAMAVAL